MVNLPSSVDMLANLEASAIREGKRTVDKDNAVIQTAKILNELDKKLDRERDERQTEDELSRKYMVRWNKINLVVGVVAILVGVVALAVDIFFRLAV